MSIFQLLGMTSKELPYDLYQSILSRFDHSNIIAVRTVFVSESVSVLNLGLTAVVGAAMGPPELQVSFQRLSVNA